MLSGESGGDTDPVPDLTGLMVCSRGVVTNDHKCGGLQQPECTPSQFWKPEVQNQSAADCTPSKGPRGAPFLPLPASGGSRQFLACGCIRHSDLCLCLSRPSPPLLCVCPLCASYKDTDHWVHHPPAQSRTNSHPVPCEINYTCKTPASKQGHIYRSQMLGQGHVLFWGHRSAHCRWRAITSSVESSTQGLVVIDGSGKGVKQPSLRSQGSLVRGSNSF